MLPDKCQPFGSQNLSLQDDPQKMLSDVLVRCHAFLYPVAMFQPFSREVEMRDFYQVLREKELAVIRVREEIEALRSIIPLLEEDDDEHPASPVYPLHAISHE
jgi:hypothetical protein